MQIYKGKKDILLWQDALKWPAIIQLMYVAWLIVSPFSYIVYWLLGGLILIVFIACLWFIATLLRAPSSKPTDRRRARAIFMHQHFGLHCTFVLAWTADRWGALSLMAVGIATDLWREYRLRHPRGDNASSRIELIPFSSCRSRTVQVCIFISGALLVVLWVTEPAQNDITVALDHVLALAGHLQFAIGRFSRVLASRGLPEVAMRFRIVMSLCVFMILYFLLFYTIPLYEYNIGRQSRLIVRDMPWPVANFFLQLFGYVFFYTAFISTYGTPGERKFWSGLRLTQAFTIQDAVILVFVSYFLSSASVSVYLSVAGQRSDHTNDIGPQRQKTRGNGND